MPTIAIAVFPDVEELDFVGPWEVLRTWQLWWPDDGAEVFTIAESAEPIRCAKGMVVTVDRTWDECDRPDVLVYPGGQGTRPQLKEAALLERLRTMAGAGTLMTSVCTGSLVFAAAGLLDGRPATTHWASLDKLGELGTDVEVRPDDRYVDSGEVVTAAGVSAGIDMALHLVRRFAGEERAREVRRFIQYDPQPPV